jgi:hypothetical protein
MAKGNQGYAGKILNNVAKHPLLKEAKVISHFFF